MGILSYDDATIYRDSSGIWNSSAYRVITFTESFYCDANTDFYNWFIANANPVVEEYIINISPDVGDLVTDGNVEFNISFYSNNTNYNKIGFYNS